MTIEDKKNHIAKIEDLCQKIRNYEAGNTERFILSSEDLDTIKRALACHRSIIVLDMKRGKENDN